MTEKKLSREEWENKLRESGQWKAIAEPEGLCEKGKAAHKAIVDCFYDLQLDYFSSSPGGYVFKSPAEWKKRGEKYDCGYLAILHEEGDQVECFYPQYGGYELQEKMIEALREVGLFSEPIYHWCSAVHD